MAYYLTNSVAILTDAAGADQPLEQAAVMRVLGQVSLSAGLLGTADSLFAEALALQQRLRLLRPGHDRPDATGRQPPASAAGVFRISCHR